jgi:ABC-type uncharacterized transport system substrate-binding protein
MNKTILVSILAVVILAFVHPVEAQQTKKAYRVGFLSPLESPQYFEVFRRGMRELGYAEGQNLIIDYRSAKGMPERFPDLAAELVRLKVDVIVAASGGGPWPLKRQQEPSLLS